MLKTLLLLSLFMFGIAFAAFAQNPEIKIDHFQFNNRGLFGLDNPALTPSRLLEGEMVVISTTNPDTEMFFVTITFVLANGEKVNRSIGLPRYESGSAWLFEIGLVKVLGVTAIPMRASGPPATVGEPALLP